MRGRLVMLLGTVVLAGIVTACGDTVKLPQAEETQPLTAASVAVKQTGNAAARIVAGSVAYRLDDSGSLVIDLQLTSRAKAKQTITVRASLYGASGSLVGDATGGEVGVNSGATVPIELNGPKPNGQIVSATFEVTALAQP